jgi:hypothetical protein
MAKKPVKISPEHQVVHWRFNPLDWVKDIFGDEILKLRKQAGMKTLTDTGLTLQQEDVLRRWGKFLEAKYRVNKGLPANAEMREQAKKIGFSIMSSNGNGKDFLLALINWHFQSTCPYSRCLVTANTGKQLKSVYWSELAKIRGLARKVEGAEENLLQQAFEVQTEMMFAKLPNKQEQGKRWFTEAVTINAKSTPDEQGEALAGRHEDWMAIFVDEASGVPDAVFRPLERTLTGLVNVCFLIFNPTKNTGYAIETHTKYRDKWECIHWNALDCENIQPSQIEALRKYGEDSPAYRIGVLGLPPVSDSNALIPFDWITEAVDKEMEVSDFDPCLGGFDVGAGGDRSAVVWRQAGKVFPIKTNNSPDTMTAAEWAAGIFNREDLNCLAVDANGLGKGAFDRLKQMGIVVKAIMSQGASQSDRYINVRAEMYFKLREQFENKVISIPNDPELINELSAIRAEYEGKKIKIRAKKEIRREYGFSPDKADALAMSYLLNDGAYRKGNKRKSGIDHKQVFYR